MSDHSQDDKNGSASPSKFLDKLNEYDSSIYNDKSFNLTKNKIKSNENAYRSQLYDQKINKFAGNNNQHGYSYGSYQLENFHNNGNNNNINERSNPLKSPYDNSYHKPRKLSFDQLSSIPFSLQLSFLCISFGYMLPWTALGSLITYYKYQYNVNLYIKLYTAFYLPGLLVAVLQYRYDEYFDNIYKSKNTYMIRGIICYSIMSMVLFSLLWFKSESVLIFLFVTLGVTCWYLHGTASMLASMFPKAVIAYLQIGFRCPEIYAAMIDYYLSLGKDASEPNLNIFYKMTAIIVLFALICWIMTCGNSISLSYFEDKDEHSLALTSSGDLDGAFMYDSGSGLENVEQHEKIPLINKENDRTYLDDDNTSDLTITNSVDSSDIDNNQSLLNHMSPIPNNSYEKNHNNYDLDMKLKYNGIDKASYYEQQPAISRAHTLIKLLKRFQKREVILNDITILSAALILTIWASIFQASYFAYVNSPKGRNIEQILYFVRLFSDLIGRPLTFLPVPWFLKTNNHLLIAAIIRVCILGIFFIYTFASVLPQNDIFICIFVGLYSAASGYLTVLIYEYAATEDMPKAARTRATNMLNMSFQIAAFSAVVMSESSILLTE
eukprot:gene13351-17907_t